MKIKEEEIFEFTHNIVNSKGYTVAFLDNDNQFYNLYTMEELGIDYLNLDVEELSLASYNKQLYQEICTRAPFDRDIQEQFSYWYNKGVPFKKIMRVVGPRQVGKTTEILKFAYRNYEVVNYINFADTDILNLFKSIKEGGGELTTRHLKLFSEKANMPLFKNESSTLVIFDEVQDYPAIYTSIKAVNRNLSCHVILTGSYLGELLVDGLQAPVGEIYPVSMSTLSFSEFCNVFGQKDNLMHLKLNDNLDICAHGKLYTLYRKYYEIGGYPDAVNLYKVTNDASQSKLIIYKILDLFLTEACKYTTTFKERYVLELVLSTAFREVCFEKKGADYHYLTNSKIELCNGETDVVSEKDLTQAYGWLIQSGILGECGIYESKLTDVALRRRIYFTDCGLANIIAKTTNIHKSNVDEALQEIFAYSELSRICGFENGLVKTPIPYCYMFDEFELDFILTTLETGKRIGIEIKSNSGNPKSLLKGIERKLIDFGVVARNNIDHKGEKYLTIPIYAVGTHFPYGLKEEGPLINRLDLF